MNTPLPALQWKQNGVNHIVKLLPGGRIDPEYCVVFEDAVAGVQAAHNAGMKAVGIGSPEILGQAELVIPGFANVTVNDLLQKLENV